VRFTNGGTDKYFMLSWQFWAIFSSFLCLAILYRKNLVILLSRTSVTVSFVFHYSGVLCALGCSLEFDDCTSIILCVLQSTYGQQMPFG